MILSLLFTFITGITLAAFYDFIKSLLPKNCWERVFDFTGTVAVLMLVFSYLPMYLLINLPLGLVVCWFITGLVTVFIGAVVFTKLIK
jgi:membrane protein insertase Oxa1/YidC/SpoIIIJ